MIAACGIPTGTLGDECVAQVFAAYRDPANRGAILSGLRTCGLGDATIRMLGVWDTVGSFGIPAILVEWIRKSMAFLIHGFIPM